MPYDPRQDPKYAKDRLFLSLIKQESRFNPNAVSPTGARGYAQVLSSTARDPGFGIAPNPAAMHDPKANVDFGKSYFDAMKKRYKGDDAAALVAYNGGPAAADRWVASGKNDKVISSESRNYYKTILKDAGGTGDYAGFSSKPRVKMPDGEEDEAPRSVTGKKLQSRLTGDGADESNALSVRVKPVSTPDSTTDDDAGSAKSVAAASTDSSDSSHADTKSSAFDLDTDFSKVKRSPQLKQFAATFIPFANQDDPRFR